MPGSTFGQLFRLSTFGESHGGAVGVRGDLPAAAHHRLLVRCLDLAEAPDHVGGVDQGRKREKGDCIDPTDLFSTTPSAKDLFNHSQYDVMPTV